MQHIIGLSDHKLRFSCLEDFISTDNPVLLITDSAIEISNGYPKIFE